MLTKIKARKTMKIFASLLLLFTTTFSLFAQIKPIPEKVQSLYDNAVKTFEIYQLKNPSEIYDGQYNESETTLFLNLSFI